MRAFDLTPVDHSRPTIFLLNGGGQRPYTKFHKATRLFKGYDCNLIALELPGHGKSAFDEVKTAEEMLEDFFKELEELCEGHSSVGLIGFSLGGLLSLKAVESKRFDFDFVITLGAAIVVSKREEKIMQRYASLEFFEKMRWSENMLDYHKEGWQTLLGSMGEMLKVGSGLFVANGDLSTRTNLHVILGDRDEVADHKLQEPVAERYENVTLHILPETSHFEYFTRSWKKLQQLADTILGDYLIFRKT